MKQYYESEVLFQLMERDGFNIPSSVPPYEAEIKAYLINQVKQAYPKLTDYEAEWLLYNYTKHLPAEFPIRSVSDVTEATFENVVPFAYQSAILKGNTILVNEENNEEKIEYGPFTLEAGYFNLQTTDGVLTEITDDNFTNSTTSWYTPVFNRCSAVMTFQSDMWNGFRIVYYDNEKKPIYVLRKNDNPSNVLTLSTPLNAIYFRISTYADKTIRCVSNKDYLKLHSVQMPVLTTTNEDGTKSNIITVNEEVELRGIEDVQDTLDCLTGEVVERVGEVVLNGSESWRKGLWGNQVEGIGFEMKIKNDVSTSVFVKAISDKILYNSSNNFQNDGEYFDMVGAGNGESWIRIRILRSKLSTEDVEGFKKWLSQNNVKILYELSDKPIKTVELTTVNEKGETTHFMPLEGMMNVQSSGEIIQPTFDMSVPVEATTQNLASFIDLEMEE